MKACFVIDTSYADMEWVQRPQSSRDFVACTHEHSSPPHPREKSSISYQHHFHLTEPLIIRPRIASGCIATPLKHPHFIPSCNNNFLNVSQLTKYWNTEFHYKQVVGNQQDIVCDVGGK